MLETAGQFLGYLTFRCVSLKERGHGLFSMYCQEERPDVTFAGLSQIEI